MIMERNRSLYKSVLLDIVSWESRERRGNKVDIIRTTAEAWEPSESFSPSAVRENWL